MFAIHSLTRTYLENVGTLLVCSMHLCFRIAPMGSPLLYLQRDGKRFRVSAGMLVSAEVNLGSRTVMEYLLSPMQKTAHEAGREM
jgi:hypothetical protein